MKNGDVCSVGNWVLIQPDVADPMVCCVEEILSPLSLDGETPQCASAVLLQCAIIVEIANTYHMPRVRLQGEFFLQQVTVGTYSSDEIMMLIPRQDILCTVNLQHNCVAHNCSLSVRGFARQERQVTSIEELGVRHTEPSDLILNTAQMRDAVHMHLLRVQTHPDEIDLTAAIFEGVKSEIDKRKGKMTPQDNSNATRQNRPSTRGHRALHHPVRSGRSSGRQRGRRGGRE